VETVVSRAMVITIRCALPNPVLGPATCDPLVSGDRLPAEAASKCRACVHPAPESNVRTKRRKIANDCNDNAPVLLNWRAVSDDDMSRVLISGLNRTCMNCV
jgi:hypothetical protein